MLQNSTNICKKLMNLLK